MGGFFYILSHSLGAVIWGILIGVSALGLFFVLVKGWYKSAIFSVASYLTAAALGVLLMFQCILICGAIAIKNVSHIYETELTEIVETISPYSDQITDSDIAQEVIARLREANPLLGYYLDYTDFEGCTVVKLPNVIVTKLNNHINWYIFRRIMWILGFVAVSAFVVIKTLDKSHKKQRRTIHDARKEIIQTRSRQRIFTRRKRLVR